MRPVTSLPAGFPHQIAPLSQNGLNSLVPLAQQNPEAAQVAAEELQNDPAGLLSHVFNLTANQRQAIQNTPKAELVKLAQPAIDALHSGGFNNIKYNPGSPGDLWCKCKFEGGFGDPPKSS